MSRRQGGRTFAVLLIAMILGAPMWVADQAQSQEGPPPARPLRGFVAPVPFGPGERAEYQVKMGAFTVGTGHMEVHGIRPVRGHSTYHLSMGVEGGRLGLRVNNLYQSWLDIHSLASRRFIQDQNEIRTKRYRHFEFFPEERRYERVDVAEEGELPTDLPLDDIAFVYYVRCLPLEIGETYTLDRYFRDSGNPVVIRVLRREVVEVPAGRFNTIVVQPIIQTSGLFGEGGRAEVYFTDDARRLMVMMNSRMPIIRSLSLHLTDVRYGTPLRSVRESGVRMPCEDDG